MKIGGLFRSNWSYLLWFCFYFFLTVLFINLFANNLLITCFITVILYIASLLFAFSSLGEQATRKKLGLKLIAEDTNAKYMTGIFNEVYRQAISKTKSISKDIKFFIMDNPDINAFAIGRNTIAVTIGAINSLNEQQIRGVLGHEFGHIAYGDTKALLLNYVGNGFFSLMLWVVNLVLKIFDFALASRKDSEWAFAFFKLIIKVIDFFLSLFLALGSIIIALNSRYSEYLADAYAYRLGHGGELILALDYLGKTYSDGSQGLLKRLQKTHPHIQDRIAKLKELKAA